MPQVPYQPFSTVRPSGGATPSVHVQTGDWGVVGKALEHLGSTVEASGNELFTRAMALQQLKNEAEATDAIAKQELGSGQLHTDYSSKQGSNAVNGFDQYQADQNNLRTSIRDGLSNDVVRRMYDRASLGIMNRNIFNGAGHAATQQKIWADGSATARIDSAAHQAGINPEDDKAFNGQIEAISDAVKSKADLWGWDEERYNDELGKAKSKAWGQRINELSRTNPSAAGKMLEENGGELRGDDKLRVQSIVKQQQDTTGARNISTAVTTGKGWDYGSRVVTVEQAKAAISHVESGGNYNNITDSKTRHGLALGKYQIMEDELLDDLKRANLPPMTPKEFLANHDAQEKVFEAKFIADMKKYGSFNEAASRWFTGRGVDQAVREGAHDRFISVQEYLNRLNKQLASGATLKQKTDAARELAERDNPTDPSYPEKVVARVETDHEHQVKIERSETLAREETLDAGMRGERSNGKVPATLEELLADPQSRDAFDALPEKEKIKVPARLAAYNRALAVRTDQQKLNQLKGMADEDPMRFAAMDLTQEPGLSQKTIGDLQKLQRQKRKEPEGNPQVNMAYGLLQSSLPADFHLAENDEPRHQLKGALQEALIYEMQQKGGKLTRDDMLRIGKEVIKEQVTGYHWYGTKITTPFYEIPVPDEYAAKVRQEYLKNGLGEPNDDEIRNSYRRLRYIEMQKKKATK